MCTVPTDTTAADVGEGGEGVLYPQILQQQVCERVGRGCHTHRYHSSRYVRGWGGGAVPTDTAAAGM